MSALAADIGRYPADEAVEASPPSATTRARKYLRRNRVGVGFRMLTVLAIATGCVLMSVQSARIAAARD